MTCRPSNIICRIVAVALLASNACNAFVGSSPKLGGRPSSVRPPLFFPPQTSSSGKSTALNMHELETAAALLNDFFRTEPFLAAFMTCSVKASAADLLAQASSNDADTAAAAQEALKDYASDNHNKWFQQIQAMFQEQQQQQQQVDHSNHHHHDVNYHRNIAFLLYGGLYQGMFLQFLYMVMYPAWYGDSPFRVVSCVLSDIAVFGPFVTLPIAYILRAVIENNTFEEGSQLEFWEPVAQGIEKYKNHVMSQGLLYKYWSIWAPAQTINQLFVPEHLRVFFVAFVSFFWVYLLSAISSQQTTSQQPTGQRI